MNNFVITTTYRCIRVITAYNFRPHLDSKHGVDGGVGDERAFTVQVSAVARLDAVATVAELQLYDCFVTPRDQLCYLPPDIEQVHSLSQ